MPPQLTLIAHAPTPAVRKAAFPLDEGLDEAGKQGAIALSHALGSFASAWTSPSRRAIETAAALGLSAKIDPLLADIDVGRWAGSTFADVQVSEPDAMRAWLSEPSANPHGGESIEELIARVGNWLHMKEAEAGRIVAVTHAAVMRAAVVRAMEAGPGSFWRIDVAPLGIVELSSNRRRWTLRSLR